MTKQELVKMVGNEDQAAFAMEILLKSVKPALVRSAIKAEIDRLFKEIKAMESEDYIYFNNGIAKVNWKPDAKDTDVTDPKCFEADSLIYTYNRTNGLLAARF